RWYARRNDDDETGGLPTVGELRAIMREGKAQIDLKFAREMELAKLVKDARARGYTEEQIQALIDGGATTLPPPVRKLPESAIVRLR
ncbi:MAG: hypothetical protein ABL888_20985, partial [Pirellulaceae bacterium]